mgnify:CR=1 FL=1
MYKILIIFSLIAIFLIFIFVKPDTNFDIGLHAYNKGNYTKAYNYLKESAEKGNAEAQYSVAVMYYTGKGVVQDYNQSIYWFKRAISNEHIAAIYQIGVIYFEGRG